MELGSSLIRKNNRHIWETKLSRYRGPYLADAGPGSMLIGYALVGILCFTVMSAMVCEPIKHPIRAANNFKGEMATWLPLSSSFTGWADRFVDPALGFAVGKHFKFSVKKRVD